jgi:hypothetical protein
MLGRVSCFPDAEAGQRGKGCNQGPGWYITKAGEISSQTLHLPVENLDLFSGFPLARLNALYQHQEGPQQFCPV